MNTRGYLAGFSSAWRLISNHCINAGNVAAWVKMERVGVQINPNKSSYIDGWIDGLTSSIGV